MAISLCSSALGKSALGRQRELQSSAQRQEDVSGTIWMYIALCMALYVCACLRVHSCGPGLAQRSPKVCCCFPGSYEKLLLSTEAYLES